MLGFRRSWVVALALVGCGGSATPPAEHPAPAPQPTEHPAAVVEAPDLSPVAPPPGLFVVGRLKRPTELADTLAHWAGVPLGLRDVLPLAAKDLDRALSWDAPVEVAVTVSSDRKGLEASAHKSVAAGFSLGLTGTGPALEAARAQGYEVRRLGPELYAVGVARHLRCAIGPALGPAPARLVCGRRAEDVEALLPYMTRGLPNEALGPHDLELELRVEPLRRSFAPELGSARLFASFLVRELQVDSPRFDAALADAAYGVADELTAVAHDVDTVRLEAGIDDQKRLVDAELGLVFGDHKSLTATVMLEKGQHLGPPPDEFFALPEDASSAAYHLGGDPQSFERLSAGLVELADSYLEHEKIGKVTRERIARVLQTYFRWDGAMVSAAGYAAGGVSSGAKGGTAAAWSLLRVAHPPATLRGIPADLAAILGDKDLRALLSHLLDASDHELPSGRLVPVRGAGVPRGTQALVLKVPNALRPLLGRKLGLGSKEAAAAAPEEHAVAIVPAGAEALVVAAPSTGELAKRIAQTLSGKGLTLATRVDLGPMRSLHANYGGFATLMAFITEALGDSALNPAELAAGLPHHGQVPLFVDATVDTATSKASWRVTVPAGVFEDLPGLLPLLTAAVVEHRRAAP